MIKINNVEVSKKDFLKALHILICATTDEDIYEDWVRIIPDEPDEEDFKAIAEDEELFNLAIGTFVKYGKQIKSGIHLNGRWYIG